MSIRAMSAVWDDSTHKGSALLLLLAIADYAHDDGTNAFPSLATLARKIRMSERNVRYLLRDLEASGEIVVEGVTNHGTRRLRVVLPSLTPLPQRRYQITCAICEACEGVHSHHKIPRGFPGGGKQGNLITVCLECHAALHLPGKADLTPAGEALARKAPLDEVRRLLGVGAKIAGGQRLPGQPRADGGQPSVAGGQLAAPDPLLDPNESLERVSITAAKHARVMARPAPGRR